jgi:hypothetical protein
VTGGALAVTAPLLGWVVLSGGLDDWWLQTFSYTESGLGLDVTDRIRTEGIGYVIDLPAVGLWALGVGGAIVALLRRDLRIAAIAALLWLGLSLARVKAASYSFPHHFLPALPGVVVGGVLGAAAFGGSRRVRVALSAVILLAAVGLYVVEPQVRALTQPDDERFGLYRNQPYLLAEPVARFLRGHTDSDDRVLVAGGLFPQVPGRTPSAYVAAEPNIYWLSQRQPVFKYFISFPRGRQPPDYLQERRAALVERPPRAIVVMPDVLLDREIASLIPAHGYRLAYLGAGARIWLRP